MSPSTSPSDLRLLSQLLDQALQLPANHVEAWLTALPTATRHLAARLRSVLRQHASSACARFMSASPRLDDDSTRSGIQPGHMAGPYRLLREIGRGGMCSVWLAECADRSCGPGRPKQVAIKLPYRALNAETTRRMAHERDITALMDHPQVARLRDAGHDAEQRPYLVLDRIIGLPLDTWCARHQTDMRGRVRLAVQIATALAHVHGCGVVHRDVKPANVMVSACGRVHLLDFGISRRVPPAGHSDDAASTERSCTPAYASPEQLRGDVTTGASDVYSLGVLVFELIAGRLPLTPHAPPAPQTPHARHAPHAPHALDRCRALLDDERAQPSVRSHAADAATAPQLRSAIDSVLRQAMAPLPAQRPASAAALADALQACLRDSGCMSGRGKQRRLNKGGQPRQPSKPRTQSQENSMNIRRIFTRPALHAAIAAAAFAALPMTSSAGVGLVTNTDLYGSWTATFSGFTGCGPTAMHVAIQMGSAGTGTANITQHGQCGDHVIPGQTFRVLTLDTNGTGTANLTCGAGCGWNLRIQVSPDRQLMNLVDVDPVNPGNFIAGVAVHY